MNEAHLHLILNHIPILGSVFGFLTLGVGLLRKNTSLIQWGLVVFVAVMLVTIPTFLTGDGAEEVVEDLTGINEALIKDHEEAADLALWSTIGLGVAAAISMAMAVKKHRYAGILTQATFFLSLVVVGLMVWTGYLGGQIRHSEFNQNQAVSTVNVNGIKPISNVRF